MKKLVVFTDLDGTLLDYDSYSFEAARPALDALRARGVPLVVCSSKTRAEIERYRCRLENAHPFISENGGAIFIPRGYFGFPISCAPPEIVRERDYCAIVLGARYHELRRALGELRGQGFAVRGFGDMTAEEVAETAGMSLEEARLAKQREFDEPFVLRGSEAEADALFRAIEARGLRHTQGRFFHIMGASDKGMAVEILAEFFVRRDGAVVTAALGDSPNDIPMLEKVDYPIIVQKPGVGHDPRIRVRGLVKAEGVGPEGWNRAVLGLLEGGPL
ncbi:MAG: mannosyl-3-phosphoglycerate phosphatase [Thermodesulfovibrionales bacterium]